MNPVDQWRAIEAAISEHWTENAVADVMGLPVRTIRRLRLLGNIHPQMLDAMAQGDLPNETVLRTIAAASPDEQASVWKKYRPKKGQSNVHWQEVARALEKRRMSAAVAKFGPEEEAAFGIVWQEDLFEQGDQDCRFTTNVEGFLSAQEAWLGANLPKRGVLLGTDEYGRAKLPPKAQQSWGKPRPGDQIGCFVNPRTGAIDQIGFTIPKPSVAKGRNSDPEEAPTPKAPRPEITQKGVALIGDLRTAALHEALRHQPVADDTLLALLVFALGASNVSVDAPDGRYRSRRTAIAAGPVADGCITSDTESVRAAARNILIDVLSCREGSTNSGVLALIAGTAVGADAFLPNMATEDFLTCLSKPGVENAARIVNVLPRNTGKETRAALIKENGERIFIHPAARFAPSPQALEDLALHMVEADPDDTGDAADEPTVGNASVENDRCEPAEAA